MPGIDAGLNENNPTIVAAFHTALLHQGLLVLLILAVAGLTLNALRSLGFRRTSNAGVPDARTSLSGHGTPEPLARRFLRISFGLAWLFDGVLQAQSSMPLGMFPHRIQPTAAASPAWVQHIVNAGATIWTYHPVQVAAAAVWIEVGIGLWLLVVPRGAWSRSAGVTSVGWGLIVWVFAESFGGIFAPGLTWLSGAPGAVLLYCAAGGLIALPEHAWATPRLGQRILRGLGLFFVGMAVLQAWPGRGFWSGATRTGGVGTLTGILREMSRTSQPHVLSSWVRSFETFDAAHGWGVNIFVVIALAAIGFTFLTTRPALARVGVIATVVLCVADWVLIEDFGFFGGVGTDPNSMIPMALVCLAGYLALVRPTIFADDTVVPIVRVPADGGTRRQRLITNPGYAYRFVAAVGAMAIVLVGGLPLAVAAASPNADPLLATAVDGTPNALHAAAPAFRLIDQQSQFVSLPSLRGKTIALTFLDPVCTSDCPVIAQEFRQADQMLGAGSKKVEFIAIDANPRFISPADLVAFDDQEDLAHVPNWRYLTGSLTELRRLWDAYGILVGYAPGGAMIAHSDTAYVINGNGALRYVLNADPGGATSATKSSFAATLVSTIKSTIQGS
jgi:cytochrome oxidase Cu insertion factor (SCO1/SenC/PrrC family)